MKITWWKTWKNCENFTVFCRRILSWWVGLEREVYQGICVEAPTTRNHQFTVQWQVSAALNTKHVQKKGWMEKLCVCVCWSTFLSGGQTLILKKTTTSFWRLTNKMYETKTWGPQTANQWYHTAEISIFFNQPVLQATSKEAIFDIHFGVNSTPQWPEI